jgi:UPF0755 protein
MARLVKRFLVVGMLLALAGLGGAAWWVTQPLALAIPKGEAVVDLQVADNDTPRRVAAKVIAAGVETSPRLLFEWFRWSGKATSIQAGSYEIAAGTTPLTLLEMLTTGQQATRKVTFLEGWTFKQVREALASAPHLKAKTTQMSDAAIMKALGRPGIHPEGRFFPDTYIYPKNSTDLVVLKQAANRMDAALAEAWKYRDPTTPVDSPDQLLILASIVEKETSHEADRGRVAGVFANRLRIGMRLQTDPTVIYGLGDAFNGNLRRIHLRTDNPYNTYTRAGLPPSPISMPSEASLKAAVNPADTDALYFVAKGDGTSAFNDDLDGHNAAVRRYILKRP